MLTLGVRRNSQESERPRDRTERHTQTALYLAVLRMGLAGLLLGREGPKSETERGP